MYNIVFKQCSFLTHERVVNAISQIKQLLT